MVGLEFIGTQDKLIVTGWARRTGKLEIHCMVYL